jgi:hypothetical protein
MTVPAIAPMAFESAEFDMAEAIEDTPSTDTEAEATAPPRRYFDGFTSISAKVRACRVYRMQTHLLFFDVGPYAEPVADGAARVGAMQGGLVGGLIGGMATAAARKMSDMHSKTCKKKIKHLESLDDNGLEADLESSPTNQRIEYRSIREAIFKPKGAMDSAHVVGNLVLQWDTGEAKAKKRTIAFDKLSTLKGAVKCMKAALGAEKVTVTVPLTKKGQEEASKKAGNKEFIYVLAGLGALVVVLLIIAQFVNPGKGITEPTANTGSTITQESK